jgi:hypothetical protein
MGDKMAVAAAERRAEGRRACELMRSPAFVDLCAKRPDFQLAIDALAPSFLALRQRASDVLCDASVAQMMGADRNLKLPLMQTKIVEPDLVFALRQWLLRNETLSRDQAARMLGERLPPSLKVSGQGRELLVDQLMEEAHRLVARAHEANAGGGHAFVFLALPSMQLVLMELGMFAAVWHCCASCRKTRGSRRCGRCGRVWYCSVQCQVNHWGRPPPVVSSPAPAKKAAADGNNCLSPPAAPAAVRTGDGAASPSAPVTVGPPVAGGELAASNGLGVAFAAAAPARADDPAVPAPGSISPAGAIAARDLAADLKSGLGTDLKSTMATSDGETREKQTTPAPDQKRARDSHRAVCAGPALDQRSMLVAMSVLGEEFRPINIWPSFCGDPACSSLHSFHQQGTAPQTNARRDQLFGDAARELPPH